MKLVFPFVIACAVAAAMPVSVTLAQVAPASPLTGVTRPAAPPPTMSAFRPMCTPNPSVAQVPYTPADCAEMRRARSFAPYVFDSCVTNVYTTIEKLITAIANFKPFETLDAKDSAAGLLETAAGGLAGYLIVCTTEGFVEAVKGQFPSTASALQASVGKVQGVPDVLRSGDGVAVSRYLVDLRATLEEASSEANSIREYFERGLYRSIDTQARDAMTRSGNIVAASANTAACDAIGADKEVRNATQLAMQHLAAMRRELAESKDKLLCAREYLNTTALEYPHRLVQQMAIQRLTRDVEESAPQRIRDAETLLAESGRQCARVHDMSKRCLELSASTRSAGACSGNLAGDWRAIQRIATGQHEQVWTITAEGLAAPKGSEIPPRARAYVRDRTLVITQKDEFGNAREYIVELDESCTRGEGIVLETHALRKLTTRSKTTIRRLGEPSPVAAARVSQPTVPPTQPRPDVITTPGVVPQTSPQATVTQGSPMATQPVAPSAAQQTAPPPAIACNQLVGPTIYAKWQQLGGERGVLGCAATGAVRATPSPQGTTGTWAAFQHGIITHLQTGPRANQAFEVHGRIKDAYGQMGGSASWLGFPVSDEYDVPGGRRSDFEGGALVWDRATNQVRAERAGTPGVASGPPPAAVAAPPAAAACEASGAWQAATEGVGSSTWNFVAWGPGRYVAREQGLGNASGTAIVWGTRLRIDWKTGGYAGFYEWDLGPACGGGAGTLVFTQGRGSSHGSRIARAAAAAEQPRAPVVTEGHVPAPVGGRNYPEPQMAGATVDWCTTWATNCGQGGADQFCRTQGHERAASFLTFNAGRTYVIGSRQICQGPHCVGFAQVVCIGGGAAVRR